MTKTKTGEISSDLPLVYQTIWSDLRDAVGFASESVMGLMERGELLEDLEGKTEALSRHSENYKDNSDQPGIIKRTYLTLRNWSRELWEWARATTLCRMARGEFDKESPLSRRDRKN